MTKLSDQILLQPKVVLAEGQATLIDAVNLIAYAKVPVISNLRGRNLIAGFVLRDGSSSYAPGLSPQQEALLERHDSEISRFRFPVGPSEYAPLQEKLLDAGESRLPYFFHEHHEFVAGRRRAAQARDAFARANEMVRAGTLLLQIGESQLAGIPIPSDAWMPKERLHKLLEVEGVAPFWKNPTNLDAHARLPRLIMSDWKDLPRSDFLELADETKLPSLLFARMLLQRSKSLPTRGLRGSARLSSEVVEPESPTADKNSGTNPPEGRRGSTATHVLPKTFYDKGHPASASPAPAAPNTEPVNPPPTAGSYSGGSNASAHAKRDPAGDHRPDPNTEDVQMLTKKEVAKMLGRSPNTVDNYQKKFPDFPKRSSFGGKATWERAEIIKWIRSHKQN